MDDPDDQDDFQIELMQSPDDFNEKPKSDTIKEISILILIIFVLFIFLFFFLYFLKKGNLSILFINDIHFNPSYNPHASSETWCEGKSISGSISYDYGTYGCNSPPKLYTSLLSAFSSIEHKPSLIINAGDSTRFQNGTTSAILYWYDQFIDNMQKIFPKAEIMIAIGNTEYIPSYGSYDTDPETFQNLSQSFSRILSSSELKTFKKGGYYFRDFKKSHTRVIVINSILYNPKHYPNNTSIPDDPWDQLAWLEDVIKDARSHNIEPLIATHIPPNKIWYPRGMPGWNQKQRFHFYNIIQKYNVQPILVGHSHLDLVMPIYGSNSNISQEYSAFASPSVSPEHGNNPGFREYFLKNGKISDYIQYFADLSLGFEDEIQWKQNYIFSSTYGSNNFRNFLDLLNKNPKMMKKFINNIYGNANPWGAFGYCISSSDNESLFEQCMKEKRFKPLIE